MHSIISTDLLLCGISYFTIAVKALSFLIEENAESFFIINVFLIK